MHKTFKLNQSEQGDVLCEAKAILSVRIPCYCKIRPSICQNRLLEEEVTRTEAFP
jgi:hypothetical protein